MVHELVRNAIGRAADRAVRELAAETIQRAWLAAYYNPERSVCRRRHGRQWAAITQVVDT